ncbi:MAG: AmmeMemoRadiSam system protein B [Promethearchaeota archaeon]
MRIRKAVRSGSWYAGSRDTLLQELSIVYKHKIGPGQEPPPLEQRENTNSILGLMTPIGGYPCAAPTAAHGFLALAEDRQEVDTIILLGNKHTREGPEISIASYNGWATPLGAIPVNISFRERIVGEKSHLLDELARSIRLDTEVHKNEHSIELQLPFLQHLYNNFQIVPIAIDNLSTHLTTQFGDYLAKLIIEEDLKDSSVIIASGELSDGNYVPYLNHEEVTKLDRYAIEPILKCDPETLEAAVTKYSLRCGVGPVKVLLSALNRLGVKSGELLNYATSGLTCGPMNAVKGYASVIFRGE